MNRSEILSMVREYMNRPDIPDTALGMLMSVTEGELNRYLSDHPRNLRRTKYTQLAADPILPMPVDMMRMDQLRTGSTVWRQYPPDAMENASDTPYSYIVRGMCAELFPAPAVDTEFDLDYFASVVPLVNDIDTNWVSMYYPDVYLYGMLKESTVYLNDIARLSVWTDQYNKRVAEVGAQGWHQNLATAPKIRNG